jgi:hypothetical protein
MGAWRDDGDISSSKHNLKRSAFCPPFGLALLRSVSSVDSRSLVRNKIRSFFIEIIDIDPDLDLLRQRRHRSRWTPCELAGRFWCRHRPC